MRIHLDTDFAGDPDDLCALALLLRSPDVELTGVTTVLEMGGRRAGYARYVLRLAGRDDVAVAAGADDRHPYRGPVELPDEAAYWPEPVAPAPGPVADALALLKRSIEAGATVVAIGPYTNLMLLDRAYPGVLARAPLHLMGGKVRPVPPGFPQWGREHDFNVQFDAPAAMHVLTHSRPTLTPLEMTVQTAIRRAHLPRLQASGPLGMLLAHQAEANDREHRIAATHGAHCAGLPDDILNFQHDPLACAAALGWDELTVSELPIQPEMRDGWLHTRETPTGTPMSVVTAVDASRFNARWLDTVCGS